MTRFAFAPRRLGRREFIKGSAAAFGASMLRPAIGRASCTYASTPTRLLTVFCKGGFRDVDMCDHYDHGDDVHSSGSGIDLTISGSSVADTIWKLPSHAWALSDHVEDGRVALVRDLFHETAAHDKGVRIGLNGRDRSGDAAAPVVIGNAIKSNSSTTYSLAGVSFNENLATAPGLEGAISGDVDALVDILDELNFSDTNTDVDNAVWAALANRREHLRPRLKKTARAKSWMPFFETASGIIGDSTIADTLSNDSAGFASAWDSSNAVNDKPSDFADVAGRFAAAYECLMNDITPMATVFVTGFDTHGATQYDRCEMVTSLIAHYLQNDPTNSTIIVLASDFNRTPKINDGGGTDHFTYGSTLVCGPVQAGVYSPTGSTTRPDYPGQAADTSMTRASLWAAVMGAMGADHSFNDVVELCLI